MKLSAVYKSKRKADAYLYLAKKDDFSAVPEALLQQFGTPIFVMQVAISKRKTLAGKPIEEFIALFEQQGFYLQMPPPPENLLKSHKVQNNQQA